MENILHRRSIRKFTSEAISEETITNLLKAAMAAPSFGNAQPWHFIVLRDRLILDQISRFHKSASALKTASVAILVCGDLHFEKFEGRWMMDCAAATENIIIATQILGLGSVWLGIYPDNRRILMMRELLELPEDIIPLALVPVGYPAEQKPPGDRFREERVHYDRW